MKWELTDLRTAAGLAEHFGVAKSTITNWYRRYPDFPLPLAWPGFRTAVYSLEQVKKWHDDRDWNHH